MRRLSAFQCGVVGLFAATGRRLATKYMFGCVDFAMYLMSLTSFWYVFVTWDMVSSSSMGPCTFVLSLYGVDLLSHVSIATFFTTYCIADGYEAWIDPPYSHFGVQPSSCLGSLNFYVTQLPAALVCLLTHFFIRWREKARIVI